MNMNRLKLSKLSLAIASATAAMCIGSYAIAQEPANTEAENTPDSANTIEEVTVLGRLKSGATSIIAERIEQAYSAEILGFEQIARVGDSNIAAALKRVTGLTLIDGKYIYVRGLGERYSSTTLNGAAVPSPDLTRNVIPLDLFPTSIVESLKVQKAFSSAIPASFGGGNINIRTKGIPDEPVFTITAGTGWNSESSGDALEPVGDNGGLPGEIRTAINTYQGNIDVRSIINQINTNGDATTPAERTLAESINRDLLTALNRDVDFKEKSVSPDISGKVALGNSWDINDDFVFGAIANVAYNKKLRNQDYTRRGIGNPETTHSNFRNSVEETHFTGAVNLGLTYQEDHTISTNSYLIENDEDEAQIQSGFDTNNLFTDGDQKLKYSTRLEERKLVVNQIFGKHSFTDLDYDFLPEILTSIDINWYYSDAEATTDIPNETIIQASNTIDPATGAVITTELPGTTSLAQFKFLELEDEVEDSGMDFSIPITYGDFTGTVSGGFSNISKSRSYYGYTVNIDANQSFTGTPGQVLTDEILLDPANGFSASMSKGLSKESYIAAQKIDAVFGGIDMTWQDTWRFSAGVRWEDFRQATLPVDLLDFDGVTVTQLQQELQDPNQRYAIQDDDIYPAMALTYMGNDLFGADDFQIRVSYAQTVIRPDLREVAPVQFLDPDNFRVEGNSQLEFTEIDHIDIRGELFYSNNDNFTVSLFYKDLTNPIEKFRTAGSDDDVLLTFQNGESGEVYGIEFEGLKDIGYGMFLSGNLTLSDSDLEIDPAKIAVTNYNRRLAGHSEYVLNAQLGYDSEDNLHSVSVAYNVFGERIFYAGRDGNEDVFEQPFHSLDIVYSYYPTENATIKLKIKNLLDETREFEQEQAAGSGGKTVTIQETDVGTSVSAELKWNF